MTAVVFLLAIFSMAIIHELAHARVMYKLGVQIREISIGVKIPFFWDIKLRLSSPQILGGTPIYFRPLPIMAFVESTPKGELQTKALDYKDQAAIYAAGSLGNIFSGVFFISLILLYNLCVNFSLPLLLSNIFFLIITSLTFLLVKFRRFSGAYIAPLIGWATMALIIYGLFSMPISQAIGGPVTTYKFIAQENIPYSLSIAAIWISIGLINLLPIMPLDGGHIITAIFRSWRLNYFAQFYSGFSLVLFAGLIGLALFSDIVNF